MPITSPSLVGYLLTEWPTGSRVLALGCVMVTSFVPDFWSPCRQSRHRAKSGRVTGSDRNEPDLTGEFLVGGLNANRQGRGREYLFGYWGVSKWIQSMRRALSRRWRYVRCSPRASATAAL